MEIPAEILEQITKSGGGKTSAGETLPNEILNKLKEAINKESNSQIELKDFEKTGKIRAKLEVEGKNILIEINKSGEEALQIKNLRDFVKEMNFALKKEGGTEKKVKMEIPAEILEQITKSGGGKTSAGETLPNEILNKLKEAINKENNSQIESGDFKNVPKITVEEEKSITEKVSTKKNLNKSGKNLKVELKEIKISEKIKANFNVDNKSGKKESLIIEITKNRTEANNSVKSSGVTVTVTKDAPEITSASKTNVNNLVMNKAKTDSEGTTGILGGQDFSKENNTGNNFSANEESQRSDQNSTFEILSRGMNKEVKLKIGSSQKDFISAALHRAVNGREIIEATGRKLSGTNLKENLARGRIFKSVHIKDSLKEISDLIINKEAHTVVLKLEPKELGEIKIRLDVVNNVVNANLHVENEAVKQLIQNNLSQLRDNLMQQGLALNNFNISYRNKEKGRRFSDSSSNKTSAGLPDEVTEEATKVKDYQFKNLGYNRFDFIA